MRYSMDFLALTDGVNATKVSASGLRIPITEDTWITIDFKRMAETALDIRAGCYSTHRPYRDFPKLAVVPLAGNVVWVEFTFDALERRPPFEVFPVDEPDRDQMAGMLASTTSGDPLGEILFREGRGKPIGASAFRVECAGTGALELKVLPADERTFHIEIGTVSKASPGPGSAGTFLNMFVIPHAANLVSVSIRETEGVFLG
jgi:hypothetical protein